MALRDGQWEVRGRVTKSVLAVTGTGKQQLAVTFEHEDEQHRKQFVTWYGFFTDAALPWTVEALRALGWDPEANNWDILGLDETPLLVGREVSLVLEEEEYEGKLRTKVRFINALGGAGVERLEPNAAKAFASDLRKRLMNVAPPKATRPATGGPSPARTGSPPAAASPGTPAARAATPAPADAGASPDLNLDDIPF
jgi:hypothetical protein